MTTDIKTVKRAHTRVRLNKPSSKLAKPRRVRLEPHEERKSTASRPSKRKSGTFPDAVATEFYRTFGGGTAPKKIGNVVFPRPFGLIPEWTRYNTRQTAAYLCVSVKTLANWRSAGSGPQYERFGKNRIKYRLGDLSEFVDSGNAE